LYTEERSMEQEEVEIGTTGKRCTTCGEVKPKTEFYLSSRKTGDLRSQCKPCDNRRRVKLRQKELAELSILKESGTHKECSWCGKKKPVEEFYYRRGNEVGKRYYRNPCKACMSEKNTKYYKEKIAPYTASNSMASNVQYFHDRLGEEAISMRHIEFPPGTREGTKNKVGLVAWATNRRGRVAWKSHNVTTEIAQYIKDHGGTVHPNDITYALGWLESHDYGHREVKGTRTKVFQFDPDVSLTGFIPEFVEQKMAERMNGRGAGHVGGVRGVDEPTPKPTPEVKEEEVKVMPRPVSAAVSTAMPPTPADFERQPRYREDELNEVLDSWAGDTPEKYAEWVDTVIAWLQREVE
jgi:hypothetical protein